MKILDGLTGLAKPHLDRTNVIAISDPALFNYPLSYMTEAGYLTLTGNEAKALREYLLKGGFIIFDDYGFPTCPGARQAVDEFFAGKPEKLLAMPSGQCVVVKI